MLDRLLLFLVKWLSGTFVVVVVLVFICSGLLLRWKHWKQLLGDGTLMTKDEYFLPVGGIGSRNSRRSQRYANGGVGLSLEDSQDGEGRRLPNTHHNNIGSNQTGSSTLLESVLGKVDSPPKYDSPPPYHVLFPRDKTILFDDLSYTNNKGPSKGQAPLTPFDLTNPKSINQGEQSISSTEFHAVQIHPK